MGTLRVTAERQHWLASGQTLNTDTVAHDVVAAWASCGFRLSGRWTGGQEAAHEERKVSVDLVATVVGAHVARLSPTAVMMER